jgi:hypothetical protein
VEPEEQDERSMDDGYKAFRTNLVLIWIFSNLILTLCITSEGITRFCLTVCSLNQLEPICSRPLTFTEHLYGPYFQILRCYPVDDRRLVDLPFHRIFVVLGQVWYLVLRLSSLENWFLRASCKYFHLSRLWGFSALPEGLHLIEFRLVMSGIPPPPQLDWHFALHDVPCILGECFIMCCCIYDRPNLSKHSTNTCAQIPVALQFPASPPHLPHTHLSHPRLPSGICYLTCFLFLTGLRQPSPVTQGHAQTPRTTDIRAAGVGQGSLED